MCERRSLLVRFLPSRKLYAEFGKTRKDYFLRAKVTRKPSGNIDSA